MPDVWKDAWAGVQRVIAAAGRFAASLVLSAFLVLAGIGMKQLIAWGIEEDSIPYNVVKFALDVSLVGSAVVVAICGGIVVAGEAIISTRDFFREWSSK